MKHERARKRILRIKQVLARLPESAGQNLRKEMSDLITGKRKPQSTMVRVKPVSLKRRVR